MDKPMAANKNPVIEALCWLRRHWMHILIAPGMLIAFTVLHESAHAFVAWVQGARIIDFVVWPDGVRWGYVRYEFAPGQSCSRFAISIAPYAMWTISMISVTLMSLRRAKWPFWAASSMFLWGYVGAFGDIVNAWGTWALFAHSQNDMANAFGPADSWQWLLLCAAALVVVLFGFVLQSRLYRELALRWPAYALLAATLALVPLVVLGVV